MQHNRRGKEQKPAKRQVDIDQRGPPKHSKDKADSARHTDRLFLREKPQEAQLKKLAAIQRLYRNEIEDKERKIQPCKEHVIAKEER